MVDVYAGELFPTKLIYREDKNATLAKYKKKSDKDKIKALEKQVADLKRQQQMLQQARPQSKKQLSLNSQHNAKELERIKRYQENNQQTYEGSGTTPAQKAAEKALVAHLNNSKHPTIEIYDQDGVSLTEKIDHWKKYKTKFRGVSVHVDPAKRNVGIALHFEEVLRNTPSSRKCRIFG